MPTSLRPRARLHAGTLAAAVFCAACTTPPAPTPPAAAVSAGSIDAVVASPDRSAADRGNDARRKPREMLSFIGVRPGWVAEDLSAGGGYTTELLARAIGAGGTVYAQGAPRDPAQAAPAAPESGAASAPRTLAAIVAERSARLRDAGTPAAAIVAVQQRFEDPVPAAVADQRLDLVTLMFNYHDLGHLGVDRARMNLAVFRALKPGGLYVIADHAGRPGTGISESGTLHRIEESFLRDEVEAAGFRQMSEAGFLRNPNDPRDRNTPEPPQPKDDFVVKFVKP